MIKTLQEKKKITNISNIKEILKKEKELNERLINI